MASHSGFTLWFTGLSGSGKSTLSERLEEQFLEAGFRVETLDGDVVRTHLGKGLSFSREDRDTNVLRVGWVASLLARNGVIVLSALISPFAGTRAQCRAMTESTGAAFIEVFTDCPFEMLVERDPKGLYRKALDGEIANFTGVSDPYEAPTQPDLTIYSHQETVEKSLERILDFLSQRGLIDFSED